MSGPLGEQRLFRRRDYPDLVVLLHALDGHPVRARLMRARMDVALSEGLLAVDGAERDVALRLSIAATTFLIRPAALRLASYRPPPDGEVVITMFDHVALTLVVVFDEPHSGSAEPE